MSEIRDKAMSQIGEILLHYFSVTHPQLIHSHDDVFLADKILAISEIAIVDRKAELPKTLTNRRMTIAFGGSDYRTTDMRCVCREQQQAMLNAGWVKEVN